VERIVSPLATWTVIGVVVGRTLVSELVEAK
jgi:hypothetical protein